MPRSRSYSRSPSRTNERSKKREIRSKERRRRSKSRSKSGKSATSNRYRSSDRSRRRSRSISRHKSSSKQKYYKRSRSKNNSRDRYKKTTVIRSSSSSSNSSSSNKDSSNSYSSKSERETTTKSDKLKLCQPSSSKQSEIKFTSVDLLDDIVKPEVLEQINADEFVPRTFTSSAGSSSAVPKKVPENIKIDLTSDIISIPKFKEDDCINLDDDLFHANFCVDDTVRMDKWIRKLFLYRQKMFSAPLDT